MSTTRDLLPNNIISQAKDLELRVAALERIVRRWVAEDTPRLLLREITTGQLFRLECEIVNGEPSLFLVPLFGSGTNSDPRS